MDDRPATDDPSAAAPAKGMYRELLWVLSHLRRDLLTVRRLAAEARDGLSPETILAEIRAQDPSLDGVVDRLEADHRVVHIITERIATVADRLPGDASGVSRFELVAALTELEDHLLGHLAFEETSLEPLLSSWERWPTG